ncbi:prepilin-type N-terminal cleavage/methylation domain-containing protein [Thalassotalea euphylliae]|uniref:prepilin-type N-terminal cleavage/methylation domain-containing protein n=1 Tax=Thalassotalea euphylliae TaxID=1655234 RepID=UPI002698C3EE|nr:prepilin-type N-terminal cleavage/methylation domain-containing protein [Thalassotalea euphylliae]
MQIKKQSQGFTLIELVVVIVVLGILSAVALPRYINISRDAEQAVFDGFVGAFRSGVNLYHMSWQVKDQPAQAFDGVSSVPSATGFPAGGSDLSSAAEGDCETIWRDVLADQPANLPFVNSVDGWYNSTLQGDWARNAGAIGRLQETSDLFCHFVYVGAFNSGAFSGQSGARVPVIQYNVQTGAVQALEWPFNP